MRATKLPTEVLVMDPGCEGCDKPCIWSGARMAQWAAEEVQGRDPYRCNSSAATFKPKPVSLSKKWRKSQPTLHV